MSGKRYGLIIPKKDALTSTTKFHSRVLNPLCDSDDDLEKDDEESTMNWIEASFKKSVGNAGQKCLQKRILKEAMREDSTIFQYDEIYDEMKAVEDTHQQQKNQAVEKLPKYIGTILKYAEKRKLEKERRQERKVQKERDAEGKEFIGKESFITSSYLKKLEEMKKAEEEERLERIMEESVDIHKHKNFGVFYNHLLKQRLGDESVKEIEKKPVAISAIDCKAIEGRKRKKKSKSPEDNLEDNKTYLKQNLKDSTELYDNFDTPSYQKTGYENKLKYDKNFDRKLFACNEKEEVISQEMKKHKGPLSVTAMHHEKEAERPHFNTEEKIIQCKKEMEHTTVKAMIINERIERYQSLFAKRTTGNAFKDALKLYFERKAMLNS